MTSRWPLAALSLALTACATGFAATPGDWAAYRETRVAPTLEQRLEAAQRYLKDHPGGVFRDEVRAYFDHAEALYYESKKDSRAGLEAYLSALPNGPHKEAAKDRIDQLYALTRKEADEASAAALSRVSGPAARARTKVREDLTAWIERFLDPAVFRAPLSEARASVVIPFSLSLPSPHCQLLDSAPPKQARVAPPGPRAGKADSESAFRRCTKLISLPYEIEVDRKPEPREAVVEITVVEGPGGAPIEITLAGPDLFLRLEETYRVAAVPHGDPTQRAAAADRAARLVENTFASAVSADDACERPPIPPVLLSRACGGVQVDVIPAQKPGEDDSIVIVPLAP